MTDFSKIKFTTEDVIKLLGIACMFIAQYFLLKTEIHDAKTMDAADKQVINYRLADLERCCNLSAIKPEEVKITSK